MATPMHHTAQQDIVASVYKELDWASDVDVHAVEISCVDGVVTLAGTMLSEDGRLAARDAAFIVPAVRTVDNQLSVAEAVAADPANTYIAHLVEDALALSGFARHLLRAEVRDHIVTLSGCVDWESQREDARRCVEDLLGVRHVINRLDVVHLPSTEATKERIREELIENALLDAEAIGVTMTDSEITLTGTVRSGAEKSEAEHAARTSPDVSAVHNFIEVRP